MVFIQVSIPEGVIRPESPELRLCDGFPPAADDERLQPGEEEAGGKGGGQLGGGVVIYLH